MGIFINVILNITDVIIRVLDSSIENSLLYLDDISEIVPILHSMILPNDLNKFKKCRQFP